MMFCFVRYLSEQIVTENIVFHSPIETTFVAPMVVVLEYEVAASPPVLPSLLTLTGWWRAQRT